MCRDIPFPILCQKFRVIRERVICSLMGGSALLPGR